MSAIHWRSVLFVPANRPDRFARALACGADAVCIDLEDAVPAPDKVGARNRLASALQPLLAEHADTAATVRINAAGTDWHAEDVAGLAALPEVACWMLPKASLQAVQELAKAAPGRRIIALLEDAQGIEEAYLIAQQAAVAALALGGADLTAQLGAQMQWDALLYARSRLVMAAAGARKAAIDVPCLELKNPAEVRKQTERVRALGFDCKAAIHPAQIAPIHSAMTPAEAEIARARKMLAAYEAAGGGAVEFEGIMLDEPVLISARRVLAQAGKLKQTES